jgi:hypothetical protein
MAKLVLKKENNYKQGKISKELEDSTGVLGSEGREKIIFSTKI